MRYVENGGTVVTEQNMFENRNDITALVAEARAIWPGDASAGETYVLILPHADARFNAKLRAAFAAKLGGRRGLVAEGRRAEALLALYCLYAFTDRLIVGSLDLPPGRKLRNLLTSGIATEQELIDDVILGTM